MQTQSKCVICNGDAEFQVECETSASRKHKVYTCRAHIPRFNPSAGLVYWEIRPLFLPNKLSSCLPQARNPITKAKAGYHAPPKLTTEMRCAMLRLMRSQGLFRAAQILTIGADEADRLEILTMARDMEMETTCDK